jgi:hypothetical protein
MRYFFKALTGAVSTDTVPPGPGPVLEFDIPRACTIASQFSWSAGYGGSDTIVAFEVSIDGVNFFQVGAQMEFGTTPGIIVPNGNIVTVITPACLQMRLNLLHMTGSPSPVLDVTWAVIDNNGLT